MSRSERWATSREKKRILIENGPGPILYCEGKTYYTNDSEGHVIFLGESGTGKTRRGIIPMVLTNILHKESMVITDPKGEIYCNTIDYVTEEYDVYKFDFRRLPNKETNTCWNPLAAPYELWKTGNEENIFRAEQMVDDLAHVMYPTPKEDPFWMIEARNVFEGIVFALFSYAKPKEVNLSSVYYFIAKGEEKLGVSTFLKEFVKMEEKNENVAMQLHSYITTANETRGGIRSTLLSRLSKVIRSESLRYFLGNDTLHINELAGDKPIIIYLILPDETPIYEDLVGLLISQLMNHFIYVAENKWNGSLPVRMNFCLDELGNIGKSIINLDHILSAGRSRNIRVALVIQDTSQLDTVFGKNKAQTIRNNVSVKILYRVSHLETLMEFSKLCGEHEIIIDGKIQKEPLITPSQLGALEVGQALIMMKGKYKFITWLPDYTQFFNHIDLGKLPERKDNIIEERNTSIFDIQSYVKDKKREKCKELMNEIESPTNCISLQDYFSE